ncbi:MAG TPA: globin domain-containing protein [Spongiibacteraceae bacterium]|nr:globin domain-containing protein [Spongiibacteraceae bacterium]
MSTQSPTITKRQHRQYIAQAEAAEQTLLALTPPVMQLIRTAWEESLAAPGDFAADLYANLFALAPAAAALFPGDLTEQRQRLTRTLSDALVLLETPQQLLLLLKASGVRHVHYQSAYAHFPILGAALDNTLQQRLNERLAPAQREAWQLLYATMAAIMCGAMASALLDRA